MSLFLRESNSDARQVGLIFKPEWTKSIVVVSEVLTRLPAWAMHHYAQATLDTLKPNKSIIISLIMLDISADVFNQGIVT
jgi:hypothetical protein